MPSPSLYQRLQADLRQAMRERDRSRISTLRTVLAAIDNAGAVDETSDHVPVVGRHADVPRRHLTEDDIRLIVASQAEELAEAARTYLEVGRTGESQRLHGLRAIILAYLD